MSQWRNMPAGGAALGLGRVESAAIAHFDVELKAGYTAG